MLLLTACPTIPVKRYETETKGTWDAIAKVKDAKGKTHVVKMRLKALREKKIRMDVTSSLGTHEASLLLNGSQLDFMVVRERKFYSGHATRRAMKRLVSFPFDPRLLHNMLFDLPIAKKGWTCSKDKKDFVAFCKDLRTELSIRWSERKGDKKLVSLNSNKATLELSLSDFSPKVENPDKAFQLKKPKKFQSVPL